MVEKAIRDILISNTGVSSIVSKRVYSEFVPQETTMPFIVFRREGTRRNRAFDGPDGLVEADFEVNLITQSASLMQSLSDEVRLAMDSYTGVSMGITVHRMMLDDESEDIEVETTGGDKRVRRRALDFRIWYYETPAA